jgi:hypothetical protein
MVAEILEEEHILIFFPHEMYGIFDASILSEPPALLPYSCHLYSQVIVSCVVDNELKYQRPPYDKWRAC